MNNNHSPDRERTLLAAERTLAAWLRTALAAMIGGLAIMRFFTFKSELHRFFAYVIGEGLTLWSCLIIIYALINYNKQQKRFFNDADSRPFLYKLLLVALPLLLFAGLLVWVAIPEN